MSNPMPRGPPPSGPPPRRLVGSLCNVCSSNLHSLTYFTTQSLANSPTLPRGPPPRGPPPSIPPRGPPPGGPPGNYMGRTPVHLPIDPPSNPQLPKPSAPAHPGQSNNPPMTPIRNPNFSSSGVTAQPLLVNNRPIHPTPLGKPPPHIPSEAPPITPKPQHPFGKLVLKIIKGANLKAGQGVFGRADPYVTLKLGDIAYKTRTHQNGGKNPVSVACWITSPLASS